HVGRRAADGGDRARPDDDPEAHHARRAAPRPRAEVRLADLRQARRDAARGLHPHGGGAERGQGALGGGPRLRPRAGTEPVRGGGARPAGGPRGQAALSWRMSLGAARSGSDSGRIAAVMRRRVMILALLVYVALDLSSPSMPGASGADPDDSVESLHQTRARATAEAVIPPASGAATSVLDRKSTRLDSSP